MSQALVDQYSVEELQNIVSNSQNLKEVVKKLGYGTLTGSNSKTVQKRIDQYNIDTSHFKSKNYTKRTEENVFIENSTVSQKVLREWYKKGNYTPYVCSICEQEPVWQGKDLTLILDHINGINNDDRLENLRWVCPNCNQQLETTGYKKLRTKNIAKKKYYCVDCGKEITYGANRCISCSNKAKANKNIPNREELKSMIRTMPFTHIGNQFNISDTGVRKWCEKYNLPTTKKAILALTDEQWEKI